MHHNSRGFAKSLGDVQAVSSKSQHLDLHGTYLEHTRVASSSAVDASCPETNPVGMHCWHSGDGRCWALGVISMARGTATFCNDLLRLSVDD